MSDSSAPDPRVSLAHERTEMAAFRTSLALDRTTLAWVRTTLAMSSFGLGMIGFFRSLRERNETPETIQLHQSAIHFGVMLVVLGAIATALVVFSHIKTLRQLEGNETPTFTLWPVSVLLATLLALLSLEGLWVFLRR